MATIPVTASSRDVAGRLMGDGYVVVTGMMTPDGVQDAHADLDRLLRGTRTGRNSFEGFGTQRIYALFAKTRVFDAAATHPLLLGVLDQVLGHCQLSAPVGIRIGPGEKAQVLHRDAPIYPVPVPGAASAAGGEHHVAPGQPLARRRREPDPRAAARRDPGVRRGLAAT